ncbi:MAG: hypothetical protein KDG54_10130, partial [Geminicoccaceae bacterium]|nr:hypothetical protein [Geminicoccaceae bacterium]
SVIWPGTALLADVPEHLTIGDECEIGAQGGFWIDARGGEPIRIGRNARLLGGGALEGPGDIGNGAQILGVIRCRGCYLAGGGSYRDPDPDSRGAVLKGHGVARNISLSRGQVIQAFDLFSEAPVRSQSWFHPPPSSMS